MKMKILLQLENTTLAQPLSGSRSGPNPQDFVIFLDARQHRWSSEADTPDDQSDKPGSIIEADQWYLKIKKTELLNITEFLRKT